MLQLLLMLCCTRTLPRLQAALYDQLLSNSSSSGSEEVSTSSQLQLTTGEAALLRRVAAWEAVKLRKRFATPAAAEAYRKATALEALVSGTL
jgi:23S rRNA maturation mini-RNase III